MKNTKKIAFAGIFSALSFIFLFVGSLFETLDLSAAALGSIVVLIAFIELGRSWALGVYAAASLLSMLMLPNKTAAVIFTVFAGFYPVLKVLLHKIRPIWLSYAVRILCFNLFLTALIYIATRLMGIVEDFLDFGFIIYGLSNVTFIVYDLALERIAAYYSTKIKPKLFKLK
jgi:riboflavin transporter FmnP